MEEGVELVKCQLGVNRLLFIPLVEQFHLQKDHTLATVGTHAVSRRNCAQKCWVNLEDWSLTCELVVKVDQLAVVNLLQQIL